MTTSPPQVRICPSCGSARPLMEFQCENEVDGVPCLWLLEGVEIVAAGTDDALVEVTGDPPRRETSSECVNGHPLDPGDQICLGCGADRAVPRSPETVETEAVGATAGTSEAVAEPTEALPHVHGWRALRELPPAREAQPWRDYEAEGQGRTVLLTLYEPGHEPDPAVHELLGRTPLDHVPEQLATGRDGSRAFVVAEHVRGGPLSTLPFSGADRHAFDRIVDEISKALASFAEAGLRHRDLRPANVLVRVAEPLDLVVTGFGSSRLSDFDLEAVAPLELSRYSAPETIVGAVSAASDWWSLGMILLEQATAGACFAGVDDRAFHLHVVTRGVTVPAGLDPEVRALLRGLLARDPLSRWSAEEVRAWCRGEVREAPSDIAGATPDGPALMLAGTPHRDPAAFALAASTAAAWDEARDLTLRGAVATWLGERGTDGVAVAEVRRLSGDAVLEGDARHALAMMALNPALPLALRGSIVTPAWLLANVEEAHALLAQATPHLERLGREAWLVRLRVRAEAVREKARLLDIELDPARMRAATLASSRANLEAERDALRRVFPDTDHAGLGSLMAKSKPADEDLVILVSAAAHQFTPLETLVEVAQATAADAGVALNAATLPALLMRPRRELFAAIDERVAGLARCGIVKVDGWADAFRIERRTALPKAAALLAVSSERWKAPAHAAYVADLLQVFEKRVSATVGRGPLARFVLGKTTPRLDLVELGAAMRTGEEILAHVVSRTASPLTLDPAAWTGDASRYARLRRFVAHADTFLRDTGIDARYLAFPFLVLAPADAKARTLPVLLWPVTLVPDGAGLTGASIMFDPDRDGVRLNPALEGLLGGAAFARFAAARDDVLSRGTLSPVDVVDVFGTLAPTSGRPLAPVPGREAGTPRAGTRLTPAAALFNAEFTGQNVAEDLRMLREISPAGSALEAAMRISADTPQAEAPIRRPPEAGRFPTAAGDPSQDEAVLRARLAPGLVVEGPPGTGKSQTIVNIVTDAIGCGESVLVICQKQAALTVVQKRLAAEGLGDRAIALVDGIRDRDGVLRALREQYTVHADASRIASLHRHRKEKAASIEALEQGLDDAHAALHKRDEDGESYRDVLGELVAVEAEGAALDAPRLRRVLDTCGRATIAAVEEGCAPVAKVWLESAFEGSALAALLRFTVDEAVAEDLGTDLRAFASADADRSALPAGAFEVDDPGALDDWFKRAEPAFGPMDQDERDWLAATLELFRTGGRGRGLVQELRACLAELAGLRAEHHRPDMAGPIAAQPDPILRERLEEATKAAAPAAGIAKLKPGRLLHRLLAKRQLKQLGIAWSEAAAASLRDALALEAGLRPLRGRLADVEGELGYDAPGRPRTPAELRGTAEALLASLEAAASRAALVQECPKRREAEAMAASASAEAAIAFRAACADASARCLAIRRSRIALGRLADRFEASWNAQCEERISSGSSTAYLTEPIIQALPTLAAFQQFRSRAQALQPKALEVLSVLREQERLLHEVPRNELDGMVRRTIRREWLKSRKARDEDRRPELLLAREEVERRVARLSVLDDEMREHNRRLLAADASHTGTSAQWEAVTRLNGPRAKRLREVFDEGAALGLMRLRPVWLMSPDVASRILPLRKALFDVVIFDEASQMPVEYAVPSLFRAKRAVVAGDEKQMPPTSFFGGRLDADGDEADDDLSEGASEAERDAAEERWNRRDIQSCPDLLQLARGFLPTVTLQIHYRSRFRELISFSNAAFYRSTLSVPARHPDGEVRRRKPIEVLRVDGLYEAQTNRAEAERVVDEFATLWSRPAGERPSSGVVTFNRKQADLIEELLATRATADEAFRHALEAERGRRQEGEDMGFFVKNLENVQGDERDVIVFSTTFGYDRHGSFKRFFGALGQIGGERRLNVAVTRARERIVLVTSMPVARISDWLGSPRPPEKPRDFLQGYLDYATKISTGDLDGARGLGLRLGPAARTAVDEPDGPDGFERSVRLFIESLGHQVVASPSRADAFGLDFAIVDPSTGLFGIGVECDAPRHPLLAQARGREIWRRRVLARSVPHVHRVSSRDWYDDGDDERGRLAAAIAGALADRRAA